jgi:hypothetical protein
VTGLNRLPAVVGAEDRGFVAAAGQNDRCGEEAKAHESKALKREILH